MTVQSEYASEDRLRAALERTWHAFFARFAHLRDVQRAAILPILSGESVLLNAPTASGKTEAVMAPTIERYLQMRGREMSAGRALEEEVGPHILLIAPTKALCNDLFRRLEQPVTRCGVTICTRTGDSPSFNREKPPQVLITTPESLDSLLSRGPRAFLSLRAIIVDEIHLLSAGGRGDQLQCLLVRLRTMNPRPIPCCASSATVPEVDRIGQEFLGPSARVITVAQGRREIVHAVRLVSSEPQAADQIAEILLETPTRKIIVFANARALVENLVLYLRAKPRLASIVFAHHGSMSREERLRTERQFLQARNAACVATSTLELGIDIGDVDRIILMGPPPDVSSLVQRIGRGSRKAQVAHVCCLSTSHFDAKRFEHLIACAQRESLFPDPVAFRPVAIVQQAFSICLQNPHRWIAKRALYDRISETAKALYPVDSCEAVLDMMAQCGYFRRVDGSKYVPEPKTEFLFDRGYMHSMIVTKNETDVVDAVTGRNIGSIYLRHASRDAIMQGSRPALTLAGKSHAVSYMKNAKLYVEQAGHSKGMGFCALEPPRYSLQLAQDFASFLNIPEDGIFAEPYENTFLVHHFLGTVGSFFLADYLQRSGCILVPKSRTPFHLRIVSLPMQMTFPDKAALRRSFEGYLQGNLSSLAKLLQPGPWLNLVPEFMVRRWVLASINLDAYAECLDQKQIVITQGREGSWS
ncbi:MAG: DEAD/DEAH box helicase [Proteobacteria bacterium]|nr:DEAD/DEAH box helicase [Pseudomonadota bacterium]